MTKARQLDALRELASHGVLHDQRIAQEIAVGLDGFAKLWKDEVLPFVSAGGAELRFVEGPHGRGKTHLLQTLAAHSEAAGFLTCHTACESGKSPFGSLMDTYRIIAQGLTWQREEETIVGLAAILERTDPARVRALAEQRNLNPGLRNLFVAYSRRRQSHPGPDPIARDLRALLTGDDTHRVFFGELFRRERNLPRPLGRLGKRNAAVWLRSLLSLPAALGFKGFTLLLDETGHDIHFFTGRGKRERQQHMANLRNLIDHLAGGGTPGCVIVYAVTQDLIQRATAEYPALAQRIERPVPQDIWAAPRRANPRAIWSRLDDLTEPGRNTSAFFERLGARLLALARGAGATEARLRKAEAYVTDHAPQVARSQADDTVRLFVKEVCSRILA